MTRRLSSSVVKAIDESKILGVRAGARSDHKFTGVWPVVVDGRVFARSWTLTPEGWYRTFLDDPLGTLQVGERIIRDAVEAAYAVKYPTKASLKYVRGFRTPRRREATIEFIPR